MKNMKKSLPIAVVGLLLSLAFIPAAEASEKKQQEIEIGFIDENGNPFFVKFQISVDQLQQFRSSWDDWENYLKEIRSDSEIDEQEITTFETKTVDVIEEIKELSKDSETGQYYFPPGLDISSFIHDNLFMLGFGARIFSIGRGRVWLPFNRQGEAFIGTKFAPMFVSYSLAFTRVRVRSFAPFSLVVSNRFFSHRLVTAGFTGLYINFEKQFFDNSVGPVLLIGKPLFINVGDDII